MEVKEIKGHRQDGSVLVWLTLPKLRKRGKFIHQHGTFQIRVHPEVLQALKIQQLKQK